MAEPKSIAVIGAGISGLSAAWLLGKRHAVTLFEQRGTLGGHSNTVDVPTGAAGNGQPVAVDTGFIVYNVPAYPNLVALFDHLDVPTAATNMSFAVSLDDGGYEYSGTGLAGVFGQPSNLLRAGHWAMLRDVRRFFVEARALGAHDEDEAGPSLAEFLRAGRFSDAFVRRHMLPMAAAIWSAPAETLMAYPARSFARFFANHGLLQVKNRPAWRTVEGGSRVYVDKLGADFSGGVSAGSPVVSVRRDASGVRVIGTGGHVARFDEVVIATHGDEALRLLDDADAQERDVLSAFRYQPNVAVLHSDPAQMPKRRRVWSSWNYLGTGDEDGTALAVSYWMNRLQPLRDIDDVFVTLNPARPITAGRTIGTFDYAHPVFDGRAMAAQGRLHTIQGPRRTWFCGSYFGSGFHEDGLQAGLMVAEALGGVRRPWVVADESGRMHRNSARMGERRAGIVAA